MVEQAASFPAVARLSVTSTSGSIVVVGEARSDISVQGAGHTRVGDDGSPVIAGGSDRVHVHCPIGTDVMAGSFSGAVELRGRLGDVRVTTKSGRVSVEGAEQLEVRTVSGNLRVATAGELAFGTVSGSVEAEAVGRAKVHTVSGRVELGATAGATVDVHGVSSRVTVSVPRGARPATRLTSIAGRVDSAVENGSEGDITVRTISGRIKVRTR